MWLHTQQQHGGVIGDNKGLSDYRFELISSYRDNLSRQSSEGHTQHQLEQLQQLNRVKCLFSKIDYIKPFKTNHVITQGSSNRVPGQPDTQPATTVSNQISTVTQPDTQTDKQNTQYVSNNVALSLTSRAERSCQTLSQDSINSHSNINLHSNSAQDVSQNLADSAQFSGGAELERAESCSYLNTNSAQNVSQLEATTQALRASINLHILERKRKANTEFDSAQPAKKSK